MIKNRYRISCLGALIHHGSAYTFVIKNHIQSKIGGVIRTSHILANLRQLQKDGYVKSEKKGLGYSWTLTKAGREFISNI